MVDQYLREMTESLAEVREATAGVMAEEKRCKKLVDENMAADDEVRGAGPQGARRWQ